MAKKPFDLLDVEQVLGPAREQDEPRRRTAVFTEGATEGAPKEWELVNGYLLLDHLGSGAHSDVYRGRHQYLDTPCAIKVLKEELSRTETVRRRFHREAQAIAKVDHPNVVKLMTYGETSRERLCIVLEYLEGRTLLEIVEREGRLSEPRLRELGGQIARGLGAIHALGLIHRDVKPGNVMVVNSRGLEQAKILDLGLVRFVDREELTHLTKAGFQLGTPAYMAPEQIASAEVGPPADWYAFGVMLHFLALGSLPAQPRPSFKELGSLAPLVERLLDPDPKRRPDAEEVIASLARPPRRRMWSVFVALGFVTLAVSIITATVLLEAQDPIVRVVIPNEVERAEVAEVVVAPRARATEAPPVSVARPRLPAAKVERKRKSSRPEGIDDTPLRIARALRERSLRREDVRHLEGAADLADAIERVEIDARMVNARLDRILAKLRTLGERADPVLVASLEALYLNLRKRAASDKSARPERMMEAEELERRIDEAVGR